MGCAVEGEKALGEESKPKGVPILSGKDGVPFPVDRKAMDDSIQVLKQSVEAAKIGDKEKMRSLQRLRRFVPANRD